MQPDEKALVTRSLQKDPAAYAELVERYKNAIYRHCFNMVRDEALAEDMAQETFIAAYYKLHTFDTSRRFSTWLFKIATNKTLTELKKSKRMVDVDDELFDTVVSPHASSHEQAEDSELHAAVSKLEPKYRTVISMYYWDGKSYGEIAETMSVPEGTVKGWISRAKESLRKELI